MSYITKQDCIIDDTLSELVNDIDIDESDIFFEDLANSLGVYTTEIETTPFPVQCRRVIRLWIYCEVCKRALGKNINKTQDGYEQDWYKTKLDQYSKDLDEEKAKLTPDMIRGISKDYINTNQKRSNTWGRA
jgi:hypothetical protein